MGIVQRGNIGVSGTRDWVRTRDERKKREDELQLPYVMFGRPGVGAVHRRSVPRAAQDRNGVREVWKT